MFAIKEYNLCKDKEFYLCPICEKTGINNIKPEEVNYDEYINKNYEEDLADAIRISLNIKNKNKSICRICFDKNANTVFVKCGHMYWCSNCAKKCKKICPICRTKSETKRVFYD